MRKSNDEKLKNLKEQGALNPSPEKVKDPLFEEKEFFDTHDFVQVKYEMLRKVNADDIPVSEAVKDFGLTRQAFYKIKNAYEKQGILGLLPKKRGPKEGHKLNDHVISFINKKLINDPSLKTKDLKSLIKQKYDILVHIRSIERALKKVKKKP